MDEAIMADVILTLPSLIVDTRGIILYFIIDENPIPRPIRVSRIAG